MCFQEFEPNNLNLILKMHRYDLFFGSESMQLLWWKSNWIFCEAWLNFFMDFSAEFLLHFTFLHLRKLSTWHSENLPCKNRCHLTWLYVPNTIFLNLLSICSPLSLYKVTVPPRACDGAHFSMSLTLKHLALLVFLPLQYGR